MIHRHRMVIECPLGWKSAARAVPEGAFGPYRILWSFEFG